MAGRGRDVGVVGSRPNGLSAAVALALEGFRVTALEAANQIGGGTRTEPLTRGDRRGRRVVRPVQRVLEAPDSAPS